MNALRANIYLKMMTHSLGESVLLRNKTFELNGSHTQDHCFCHNGIEMN